MQSITCEQISYIECLYEGREIIKTSDGLDYYGNANSLEESLSKELDDLLKSYDDEKAFDLTNLSNYDRATMKKMKITVKACLDFIDIKFTTTSLQDRSNIKKYLTEKTGVKHFIKVIHENDDVLENQDRNDSSKNKTGKTFVIRLHDIERMDQLMSRLSFLKHYNSSLDIEVVRIERAIDFKNTPQEMRIALFKAVKLSKADNCRSYNPNKITFPRGKGKLKIGGVEHLYDDCSASFLSCNTIYINDRNETYCLRIYFKTTDSNGKPLKPEDYRVRLEQTYAGNDLLKLNNNKTVMINDLENVINEMSKAKALSFTRLRNDAFPYFICAYEKFIQPYGLEKTHTISKSGKKVKHRRNNRSAGLCRYLEAHTEFNQIVKDAQKELVKKFKI